MKRFLMLPLAVALVVPSMGQAVEKRIWTYPEFDNSGTSDEVVPTESDVTTGVVYSGTGSVYLAEDEDVELQLGPIPPPRNLLCVTIDGDLVPACVLRHFNVDTSLIDSYEVNNEVTRRANVCVHYPEARRMDCYHATIQGDSSVGHVGVEK